MNIKKALVVDDSKVAHLTLRKLLLERGIEVDWVGSGEDCVKYLENKRPDIVFMDVMMPGMDGFEVARTLRRHPDTAHISILMFTAKTSVNDKLVGYNAGIDIYLTKPIHPVELNANIKTLLSQRQARTEKATTRGYVVGVIGARGGVGASTLALNLAVAYHRKTEAKAIAAEMRPGQGTWSLELNINDTSGLISLLRMDTPQITPEAVIDKLAITQYGVRLLLASTSSADSAYASAIGQYESILRALAQSAPITFLDIGTPFLPAYELIISLCNEILLVTEPISICVQRTAQIAEELGKKGFGTSRTLSFIQVNRTQSSMTLNMTLIEKMLGHAITLGFPPAAELAFRANEQHMPLFQMGPETTVGRQFTTLAEQIATRASA
jgi:pilus assembly protein CpaE